MTVSPPRSPAQVRSLRSPHTYVEELSSPILVSALENRKLKRTLIRSAIFQAYAERSFSLRRGLDSS